MKQVTLTPLDKTPPGDASGSAAPAPAPVWLVMGYRAGEREQILALAEALALPYEIKVFSYKSIAWGVNLFRGSDLRGIEPAEVRQLTPPWPRLVISAGMKNEPICRWIRNQSGGYTKIVHIGRPWADPARFDLVITTPQYRLPQRPNVVQNQATLHRVSGARLEQAGQHWRSRFAHLPRPYIAVIIGGNSGPYTLGKKAAQRLMAQAVEMARIQGGSLLVTTSARTAQAAARICGDKLDVPAWQYQWRRDDPENPYFGYLALADSLIVTADSISMVSEACATGKPVYLFDLKSRSSPSLQNIEGWVDRGDDFRLGGWFYRYLMRWGPNRLSRDIDLVHQQVIAAGQAAWLGETFPAGQRKSSCDMSRALGRVRRVLES